MISQILKSIILVSLVSSVISYILFKNTSKSFVEWFAICTIIQFLFFYFYNNVITFFTKLKLEKENIEAIKLINNNTILINCESCKKINNVKIDLSRDNEFNCTHCDTQNILNIEYTTIAKTKIYE